MTLFMSRKSRTERDAEVTAARQMLEAGTDADWTQLAHAIVIIGKPFDLHVIQANAALVATYLEHSDHVVRHEALWLLGSWGQLLPYADRIHRAAYSDPDVYNRGFAAKCLGRLLERDKLRELAHWLLMLIEDGSSEEEVRLSAYSGILEAWNRPGAFELVTPGKTLADVDVDFLEQIRGWAEGKSEMPQVTPPRGMVHSFTDAWRAIRSETPLNRYKR